MKSETLKLIHAFRNALVLAAETQSHECFGFHRWSELNGFPYGCCDLVSNFLAQYLKEKGYEARIIWLRNGLDEKEFIDMKSHVFVRLDDKYIDLTLNQFKNFNCRIRIEDCEHGTLGNLIRKNVSEDPRRTAERDINLNDAFGSGMDLYLYVSTLTENLLAGKQYVNTKS